MLPEILPAKVEGSNDADEQESSKNMLSPNREGKCLLTCMLDPAAIMETGKMFLDQAVGAIVKAGEGDADDVNHVKTMMNGFSQLMSLFSDLTKN